MKIQLIRIFIFLTAILLSLAVQASSSHTSSDLKQEVDGGSLGGTLLLPQTPSPWPVVLIIPGSGPTDRDGNQAAFPGKNNSLLQLADGLAKQGIASLRVDKRAADLVALPIISEYNMSLSVFIDDAVAWIEILQADSRFSSVTVAGHSQGSQVGMNAAWITAADGFVSLAGPGRPIFSVLREQLQTAMDDASRQEAFNLMDELEKGRKVPNPPASQMALFRPSIQGFLMSWQKLQPTRDLSRLSCPVTIIQGQTDLQVSEEDARLLHEASPQSRLLLLPGVNHIFKPVDGEAPLPHQLSLFDPDLVFSQKAIDAVVELTVEAEQFRKSWDAALARALIYNAKNFPKEKPENLIRNLPEKISNFARAVSHEPTHYKFGLADHGYVSDGKLVEKNEYDCVSFMYQTTELARSTNERDQLSWAMRTRFAGAHPDSVIDSQGRANYDRKEHLDYSLDMIRSGLWGENITTQVGLFMTDHLGTSRYPAETFSWVPTEGLDEDFLQEGDIIWLVLNPENEKARNLRDKYGLVIGHLGLMAQFDDELLLVHAASSDLDDEYKGGQVVSVSLSTYLKRVDRYAGVMVTRLK
ncbi:MAG: hypothetical protein GY780_06495 [bacterium]|nr:hypothetical protein [bacterium]